MNKNDWDPSLGELSDDEFDARVAQTFPTVHQALEEERTWVEEALADHDPVAFTRRLAQTIAGEAEGA
ncbi:hypothetical protein ACIGXM_14525 [Kitasatospora sp. NPDC052896]|uniref:hypothetical protein n=1 Tax=Kitasatospora sp. NPDC052896 TaxID=3364061 RepID=UPI0037C794FC